MSRSEHWTTPNEIKRQFPETTSPGVGAGALIYYENGKKYCNDSEAHMAVIGRTGKGKSQCCSLPFQCDILEKKESGIWFDPKGESYRQIAYRIPPEYQVFCVDFRNPRKSPTKWNPLETPYQFFKSEDRDENDIASSMLSELWNGVYPYDGHSDKFWSDSAANYAKGLTYGLFETAPKEQINLESIAIMMEQPETYVMGCSTLLKDFYEALPLNSLARRNLAAYASAPNDTRASIHSVAASGLEVFSRSKGLMELLGNDTLKILKIDVDRPFILFIITPDETDVYDALAGLLVSQVSQHLIRVAQERGGKLPIRVNIILEELGSIGKSIPALPNLMVASRSRNIRLMLVLQSISQLIDVYGKSKAETINSCIGITFGFSTNSWETLNEWSQRCGEKLIDTANHTVKEPLVTASQLAAMPTGTALVLIDSRYKYVTQLPFFHEMFDKSDWHEPPKSLVASESTMEIVDFKRLVISVKAKQRNEEEHELEIPQRSRAPLPFSFPEEHDEEPIDIDNLISKIDAKIAKLEADKEKEKKGKKSKKEYKVMITVGQENHVKLVKAIVKATGVSFSEALSKLTSIPCIITFSSKKKAESFKEEVVNLGNNAKLLPICDCPSD